MATLESCLYFCLILVAQDPRHMSTSPSRVGLHPWGHHWNFKISPSFYPLITPSLSQYLPLPLPLSLNISPPFPTPSPPLIPSLPQYLSLNLNISPPLPLLLLLSPSISPPPSTPKYLKPISPSISPLPLPLNISPLSPLISPSPSQYLPFSFPLPTHIIICLSSIVL